MLSLPSSDSPLRQLFDTADLATITQPANRVRMLPTYRAAVSGARATLATCPSARAAHAVCIYADGTLRLIRIGRLGGVTRLWNFGTL